MSAFQLDKLLYQLRDPRLRARLAQDAGSVLREYELTADEARAIADGDLPALHRLGANGYLLLAFSHARGGVRLARVRRGARRNASCGRVRGRRDGSDRFGHGAGPRATDHRGARRGRPR